MFYDLRLLSAIRALRVDCHVDLIGVGLEEEMGYLIFFLEDALKPVILVKQK